MIIMRMNGKFVRTLDGLMRNLCLDELLSSYFTGELEIFLDKVGEHEKAAALKNIPDNAFLLVRLYEVFGLDPELTEDEIREKFS